MTKLCLAAGVLLASVSSQAFATPIYTYTLIAPPGAVSSSAFGVNDSGQVTGFYDDGTTTWGFIYDGSGYIRLAPPGATYSVGRAINASGKVTGEYFDGAAFRGFIYDGTGYTTLVPPGAARVGFGTTAEAINASGQVVGFYSDGDTIERGFIYDHGAYTTLTAPGSRITWALGINDSGQVAGYSYHEDRITFRGFHL